jgi:hypothetical protein
VEKERCNKSRAVNYYTETDRTVDVKKKRLKKAKSKKPESKYAEASNEQRHTQSIKSHAMLNIERTRQV